MRKGYLRLAPGTVFQKYRLVSPLGEGGMGVVWKAIDLTLKKHVAIKTLKSDHAKNALRCRRFLREGQAASRIRHSHVVDVYDVGALGETFYLVMEFLEGESLSARLHRERVLPLDVLADILLPVCAAVAAVHKEGVVHRDLKPDNIFLARTHDGSLHPKVLDFGISRVQDEEGGYFNTATADILGTPHYMAPEQARGNNHHVTEHCDQYSLGVVLYRGATGVLPIDEPTLYNQLDRVVHGRFVSPRSVRPDVPEEFERVVLRAMENRAEDRFPSVKDLGVALLPFASERTRMLFGASFQGMVHTLPEPAPTAPVLAPDNSLDGTTRRRVTPRRVWSTTLLATLGVAVLAVCIAVADLTIRRMDIGAVSASPSPRPSPPAVTAPLTLAPPPGPLTAPPFAPPVASPSRLASDVQVTIPAPPTRRSPPSRSRTGAAQSQPTPSANRPEVDTATPRPAPSPPAAQPETDTAAPRPAPQTPSTLAGFEPGHVN